MRLSPPCRRAVALGSADGEGGVAAAPRLPTALGRRDRERARIAGQPPRHSAAGGAHAARHPVRDGAAHGGVDGGLPGRRAPGGRLGRSCTSAPGHDRRRHRSGACTRLGPGRLRRRWAHPGPVVRRHTDQRHPHCVLRRRLSVLPPCARRAGAPGRREREVDRQRAGRRGGGPEPCRRSRSGDRQLGGRGRGLGELSRLGRRRGRHPQPRVEAIGAGAWAPKASPRHRRGTALRLRRQAAARHRGDDRHVQFVQWHRRGGRDRLPGAVCARLAGCDRSPLHHGWRRGRGGGAGRRPESRVVSAGHGPPSSASPAMPERC